MNSCLSRRLRQETRRRNQRKPASPADADCCLLTTGDWLLPEATGRCLAEPPRVLGWTVYQTESEASAGATLLAGRTSRTSCLPTHRPLCLPRPSSTHLFTLRPPTSVGSQPPNCTLPLGALRFALLHPCSIRAPSSVTARPAPAPEPQLKCDARILRRATKKNLCFSSSSCSALRISPPAL